MTTKPDSPTATTQLTASIPHLISAPEPLGDRTFEMRFTSTPRGARLARRLTAVRLDAWGIPYDATHHDEIVLIVAELTANAVRHGHVPGRDFHLRVHAPADGCAVRVEVTDTRAELIPRRPAVPDIAGTEETGRGLLLVSRLAARWDWRPRSDGPGKTVWAEYVLPGRTAPEANRYGTDAVAERRPQPR
ncbi:ATP-binding protein [Streptomyces sp. V4I2]|uniref:ATP-binding protein n=1 Tax=Streptomyces sp. V4I2 TaxID=3042280 RepID=UPI0027D83E96|nr:ATP-binding protein [Streptomyces sp. V4I2]